MRIRPMESADIPAAVRVEIACFSAPWSAAAFASSLASGNTFFLLAEDKGAPAGYIGVQLLPPEGDILNLAVLPEYRRQGVGRALLEAALVRCRAGGADAVMLEVRASNTAAQRLYASAGFRPVGRRKDFYTAPAEDALLMRVQLGDPDGGMPLATRRESDG
ncbi:MAG: ribosomal protein S18-alanine N-acetyltransferase [Candidatus Howiella sp.]|jgi:ribosomal-protein-alanine N-acetyltransferase